MRQGSEVAAGAYRSAGGNHGMDVVIQEREERLHDFGANTAESLGEDVGAEQKHGAHFFFGQWIANAAGVAAHQIALQSSDFSGFDADVGELAEAGIDPINGCTPCEKAIDHSA